MKNSVKKRVKKVIAIIGLVVIIFLLLMMIAAMIQGNGNMVMGSLISIIFVSILFYIALYIVKK